MNQKTTQTRLMEAIATERQRLASRRGFLSGAAKVAGGGALAMAALPASGGLRSVVAQDFADDLDILNYALTLEHLESFFYTEGLTNFEEGDFTEDRSIRDAGNDSNDENDDDNEVSIFARLEEVRDHEQAHVETLTQTINDMGGTPVEAGEYDFGDAFDDPQAFLETADALENTGVAAYLGAAGQIQDPGVLAAAGSILAVEARHASYLDNLVGESPFPEAFAKPLSRDEVLAIAGDFIVGQGSSSSSSSEDATETPEDSDSETDTETETETPEDTGTEAPDETETEEPDDTETAEPEETESPEGTETPEDTGTEESEDNVEVPATSTP